MYIKYAGIYIGNMDMMLGSKHANLIYDSDKHILRHIQAYHRHDGYLLGDTLHSIPVLSDNRDNTVQLKHPVSPQAP